MRIRSRLHRWDKRLFKAVANAHLPGLEGVLPPLSKAANNGVLWAVVAGGLAFTGRRRLRRAATRGLLAVSMASPVANVAAKQAFKRKRPLADMLPLARVLKTPLSTSFPSGHSATAAAFATAVAMEAPRRVSVPVGVVAGAVCFSRVYTGVHYPGDVLAGAAIGVAAGLFTRRLWPKTGGAVPILRTARTGGAVPVLGKTRTGRTVPALRNTRTGGTIPVLRTIGTGRTVPVRRKTRTGSTAPVQGATRKPAEPGQNGQSE